MHRLKPLASPVTRPNALLASFCHRQCTISLDRGYNITTTNKITVSPRTVWAKDVNSKTKIIIRKDLVSTVRAPTPLLPTPTCNRPRSFTWTSTRRLPTTGNSVRRVSRRPTCRITQSLRAWPHQTVTNFTTITSNNNSSNYKPTGKSYLGINVFGTSGWPTI